MWSNFARGWRQLRSEKRRYALAAIGLTFGVALLIGTLATADSIERQIDGAIDRLAGPGDVGLVSVVPGEPFPATAAVRARELPDVSEVVPSLSSSSVLSTSDRQQQQVVVTGIRAADIETVADNVFITGRAAHDGAAELAVPADMAASLGIELGDNVTVASADGHDRLRVVGLIDSDSAGLFATNNVFTSRTTAERLFDAAGKLTRIDLALAEGVTVEDWITANNDRLPGGLETQNVSALASTFDPILKALTAVLGTVSFAALGVGALLAGLAFAATVQARRRTYATMRAVGATRRWLARSVAIEATLLGAVCVVCGIVIGIGLAWLLSRVMAGVAGLPTPTLTVAPTHVALGLVAGVVASLAGAATSIIEIIRHDPIAVLHDRPTRPSTGARWALLAGAVLLGAAAGCLALDRPLPRIVGVAAALAGAAVLAPALVTLLARGLRLLLAPATGIINRRGTVWTAGMACQRLARGGHDGRGIAAVNAVVAGLGIAALVAVSAVGDAMTTQLERQFGADVQVTVPGVVERNLGPAISSIPGVAHVARTVNDKAALVTDSGTEPLQVMAVDPARYFTVTSLPWVNGDDIATPQRLAAGGAVVLPAATAERHAYEVGDRIAITDGTHTVHVTIAGTYASLITGNRAVVDQKVGNTLSLQGPQVWSIEATRATSPVALRDKVAKLSSDVPGASTITAANMLEEGRSELASYTTIAFSIVIVALVLGAIGLAGAMALGVARRAPELALLRAAGATRRQLRQLVVWEAIMMTVAALVVAILAGQLAGSSLTAVVAAALGAPLSRPFVPVAIAGIAAGTLALAAVAAVLPARRAARVDPIKELRAE